MENYENYEASYLEIIMGPMFSGKTTRLLEIAEHHKSMGKNVVIINTVLDNRQGEGMEYIATHDGHTKKCISTKNLSDINDVLLRDTNTICINEAQFFSDLEGFVKNWLKYNKYIVVSGLDGDYRRKKFGHILDLIPFCDSCIKVRAICRRCKHGNDASFSMRNVKDANQVLIGDFNEYEPACRMCYEQFNTSC